MWGNTQERLRSSALIARKPLREKTTWWTISASIPASHLTNVLIVQKRSQGRSIWLTTFANTQENHHTSASTVRRLSHAKSILPITYVCTPETHPTNVSSARRLSPGKNILTITCDNTPVITHIVATCATNPSPGRNTWSTTCHVVTQVIGLLLVKLAANHSLWKGICCSINGATQKARIKNAPSDVISVPKTSFVKVTTNLFSVNLFKFCLIFQVI